MPALRRDTTMRRIRTLSPVLRGEGRVRGQRVAIWRGSQIERSVPSPQPSPLSTGEGSQTGAPMIRVGVVGLGMMGLTHLDAYTGMADVEVTAIADANPARLSGEVKAKGNVEGQAQGRFDFAKLKKFSDGKDL